MRKFLAGVMLAALAGSTVQADILGIKNIAVDGSVEFLGNKASNEQDFADNDNDTRGDVQSRVMIGANGQVTEGVNGRVEFYRNGDTAGTEASFDSSDGSDFNDEQSNIELSNAYVDLVDFLWIDQVRLGRQYAGRAGDLIVFFGPIKDDNLSVSFLDALSLSKRVGPININFVTGKLDEDDGTRSNGNPTNSDDGSGDINVTWITAGSDELIKSEQFSLPLEVGFYLRDDANAVASADNDNRTIIDLRAGINLMDNQVKFGLEYAMNGGQINTGPGTKSDYEGDALVFTAAFAPTDAGWGVHALYANASGDENPSDDKIENFQAINSDFRFGHILTQNNSFSGGSANTIDSLTEGVNVMGFGGMFTPPVADGKFTLMGDLYMVKANEVASGADDGIGTEIDLGVKYAHNDYVTAKAGVAMLMPDEGLINGFGPSTPGLPDDNVMEYWAKLMLKWGGAPAAK